MTKTQAQIESFVAEVLSAPAHVAHRLQAVSVSPDGAIFDFTAGPAALAPNGGVHGGVLAMLMEPAAVCAVYPLLPDGAYAVTADMHVQHMHPARAGARLRIEARALRVGKALAFCEARVMDGDAVCSTARLTKAVVISR